MVRLFFIMVLMFPACYMQAQIRVTQEEPETDTLHVVFKDDKWAIEHEINERENLFMISRRYHVPPALLADMNGINFQTPLIEGRILYIPYGPFNQAKSVNGNRFDVRPLYYIVRKYDNLFRLAHLAGVQQKTMQGWNGMTDNYIEQGQRLFVGWVLYDATSVYSPDTVVVNEKGEEKKPVTESEPRLQEPEGQMIDGNRVIKKGDQTIIVLRKGSPYDTLPEIQKAYMTQTDGEQVITEEKGTAVFFENKGRLATSDIYFAFHNTAKPGTIIKVHNPGTDKTVYVKVLGPIPNAKLYHNSIIGIGDGAKEALLVTEDKAWCELTYAPPF